jgi:hypothetical protein
MTAVRSGPASARASVPAGIRGDEHRGHLDYSLRTFGNGAL